MVNPDIVLFWSKPDQPLTRLEWETTTTSRSLFIQIPAWNQYGYCKVTEFPGHVQSRRIQLTYANLVPFIYVIVCIYIYIAKHSNDDSPQVYIRLVGGGLWERLYCFVRWWFMAVLLLAHAAQPQSNAISMVIRLYPRKQSDAKHDHPIRHWETAKKGLGQTDFQIGL